MRTMGVVCLALVSSLAPVHAAFRDVPVDQARGVRGQGIILDGLDRECVLYDFSCGGEGCVQNVMGLLILYLDADGSILKQIFRVCVPGDENYTPPGVESVPGAVSMSISTSAWAVVWQSDGGTISCSTDFRIGKECKRSAALMRSCGGGMFYGTCGADDDGDGLMGGVLKMQEVCADPQEF